MKRAALVCFVALITCDLAVGARKGSKRPSRNRTAETAAVFDPSAVNDPNVRGNLRSRGSATLRAQILLARAHFSPGEIDGSSGANFSRALKAFQESHSLPVSGELDDSTWQALNRDTAPALAPYRVTPEDVAGPFTTVPQDMMEQAKLTSLGFESPAEALGEEFHISPQLLQRLNPGKNFAAGEELMVPNVFTPVTGKAAQIVVTKSGTVQALDA